MTPEETSTPDETMRSSEPAQPEVDTAPLERSQQAIDEAREAAKRVEDIEVPGEDVVDPGGLPAFAESTPDAEEPAGSSQAHEDNADDLDDLED